MECWKSDVASFANPGIPGVWGQPYGVSLLEFFINVPVKLLELEALFYTRFMGFLGCFIRSGWANPFLDGTKGDSV
tara:strand:+ start:57 stop:284 length:228 start_codon:yes stop_codon:yes gene_type:complete